MSELKNYELLKEIINKEDPLGLIDPETPESLSEYNPEIKEIFKKDILAMDKEELGEWIYQVFVSFFDEELVSKKDKYYLIADKFLGSFK
ncbi:MAG: hypothetical protein NTZ18_04990 [Candidatus Komeilibacteria bacterium]|nr:hypothetical protein [Candidatus Komeilibacteria bacterium]